MEKGSSKRGFGHIFFMGAVLLLFLIFSTLSSEAMKQKLTRKELEVKLQLDYAAESYYLLLREGEMTSEPGLSYGDLSLCPLKSEKPKRFYIQVLNEGGVVVITPWFQGKRRGEYEIRNEEGIYDDGSHDLLGGIFYAHHHVSSVLSGHGERLR